jgi:hypothetical protein
MDIPRDTALALGILANSVDRYDLMRAIKRCDELAAQIRQVQLIHSENLCRVANHLAYDTECECCAENECECEGRRLRTE